MGEGEECVLRWGESSELRRLVRRRVPFGVLAALCLGALTLRGTGSWEWLRSIRSLRTLFGTVRSSFILTAPPPLASHVDDGCG